MSHLKVLREVTSELDDGAGFNYGKGVLNLMAQTQVEKELRLIRQRLESIEEALAEEMTEDDRQALSEALKEHMSGKTVPFTGRKR